MARYQAVGLDMVKEITKNINKDLIESIVYYDNSIFDLFKINVITDIENADTIYQFMRKGATTRLYNPNELGHSVLGYVSPRELKVYLNYKRVIDNIQEYREKEPFSVLGTNNTYQFPNTEWRIRKIMEGYREDVLAALFFGDLDANEESGLKLYDGIYKLINNLFDTYLGELPATFTYKGKEYTPKTFAQSLGLNMDDYIELTSFTHQPYYQQFAPEIPDNWERKLMYNLPLDELIAVTDHALKNGYTVCWDGDVSEKGFSHKNGVAINPEVKKTEDLSGTDFARWQGLDEKARLEEAYKFAAPCPEVKVTPEIRQAGYESFVTTDDHLMHLTGIVKDQNGTKYYITKNSWGTERNTFGGYLNMSESYVRAKTIYILVHKDGIPKDIKKKLGL